MCKRGLKFVAPIVAETTVAEGRFEQVIEEDGQLVPGQGLVREHVDMQVAEMG